MIAAVVIAIAVMMLLVAASLAGWVPALRWLESGRWGQAMGCRIRELLDAPSLGHCFLLGAANGWLPCGPVLAAELRGIDAAILTRSVDIMISRLRGKLGDSVKPPRFIQTIWGRGYSFVGVPVSDA